MELEEVPLGAGRIEDVFGANALFVEDDREFVHQRDVEIALGVFDDLRGLGDHDVWCAMHTDLDDGGVGVGHAFEHIGILTCHDLDDFFERVLAIARIDALGAVAEEEINTALLAADALDDRTADFFGHAWINGRLEDNHDPGRCVLDRVTNGFTGLDERREIGASERIDRSRYGDDEECAVSEPFDISRHLEVGLANRFHGLFAIFVDEAANLLDTTQIDIEADRPRNRTSKCQRDG